MPEVPFALRNPDQVIAMPDLEQVPLLWEALLYVESEEGRASHTQEVVEMNVKALRQVLGGISFRLAHKLREEGAFKNLADPRWRMNYRGPDENHIYESGAFPPVMLVWDPEDNSWADLDKPTRLRMHKEMAAWGETAAGRATLPPEDVQRLIEAIAKAQESSDEERRAFKRLQLAKEQVRKSEDALAGHLWFNSRFQDGALERWIAQLGLENLGELCRITRTSGSPPAEVSSRLLAAAESSGELDRLYRHLRATSPGDAKSLSLLRSSIPKDDWKPYAEA